MTKLSPLTLGKYLAREIMHRGLRGSAPLFTFSRRQEGLAMVKGGPSALKANALGIIFYGILSTFMGIPVAIGQPFVDPTKAFEATLTLLAALCIMLSLMQVTPFTATFIREGVIDLVKILPIDSDIALRAYLVALYLYWGYLSIIAMFVPFLALSSIAVVKGSLSPFALAIGIFVAISSIAFSTFLGLSLGMASYSYRKKLSLRIASTIAWLASFSVMYLVTAFNVKIVKAMTSAVPSVSAWLKYLPIIGATYATSDPLALATSIATTIAIVVALYRASISKLGTFLSSLETIAKPQIAPKVPKIKAPYLRTRPVLWTLILKDVKLLSREPRRLAGLLYLVVFPIVFSIAFVWGKGGPSGIYLTIPCLMGVMTGLGSDSVYFVEGSGAKVLYHLPISKKVLALSKALTTSLLTAPIACVASALIVEIATGNPILSGIAIAVTLALNVGTSMLNSAINAKLLPKEPSDWSELSLGSSLGTRFAKSLVKILLSIASMTIPIILTIVATIANLNWVEVAIAISIYIASILVAGALAIAKLKGDLTQ